MAVLEVSRNYERTIGIQLPQTATVALQASNFNNTNNSTSSTSSTTTTTTTHDHQQQWLTLNSLAHLNGTNFAVTIGQATANLLADRQRHQDAAESAHSRLGRAGGDAQDRRKASDCHRFVPDGAATAIVSSRCNTQFQYIDVGVNIDMKPTIHYDRDVTLKLKIEVSSQNGTSNLSGINRADHHPAHRRSGDSPQGGRGEHAGRHFAAADSNSLSGTPGPGEVPILKYIFSSNDKTTIDDEIVFLLIPHVVRAEMLNPLNLRELDTGTGNTIELRHISQDTTSLRRLRSPETSP